MFQQQFESILFLPKPKIRIMNDVKQKYQVKHTIIDFRYNICIKHESMFSHL